MEVAMSVLLRHPAAVPALFSRAVEPEPEPRPASGWRRLAIPGPMPPASAWAMVVLIEVPLVKAGMAVVGLALHP